MSQCPICYSPLEVRQVAPCFICGHLPEEIEHLRKGDHQYAEYEVFGGLRVVLCTLDMLEFGLFAPAFFGLPEGMRVRSSDLRPMMQLDAPSLGMDKYCPDCRLRLSFLNFVRAARDHHGKFETGLDL